MSARGSVFDQYRCSDIYNALDTGNYSLALTKADHLLRKGFMPLAGALRSIALLQMGREEEAEVQVNQLLQGKLDSGVLAPLSLVMPRIGMSQKLAELYLLASQAHPKDLELAEEAMSALLKAHMYQRAQQLLLKQFREKKDDQSYWRYLQVAVLHVRVSLTQSQQLKPPGSVLALNVAQRLVKDYPVDDNKLTEETLSLYLRFYLLLGKNHLASALPLLETPAAKRLVENSLGIQFLLREAWEVTGNFDRVLHDCRQRISNGDRNWAVISLYIRTLILESKKTNSSKLSYEEVATLIDAAEKDHWTNRGSFLGVLETFRLARNAKISTECMTERGLVYINLLIKYYSQFSTRASCFEDVQPYLVSLNVSEQEAFDEAINQSPQSLTTEDGVVRCVNFEKVQYLLKPDLETFNESSRLLKKYITSLEHMRFPDTEMQLGDDLILLTACKNLVSSDIKELISAATITKFGVIQSKRAYHLRLLYVRLLLQLGAIKPAFEQFCALGLKAVQWDTAAHYGLDRNTAFGGSLTSLYQREYTSHLKKFYSQSQIEVPDVIGQAFMNNKFSQISSLCEFDHRVNTSCSRALIELDLIRGKLIEQDLVDDEKAQAIKIVNHHVSLMREGSFSDQRDHSLISCFSAKKWTPVNQAVSCGPLRADSWIMAFLEVLSLVLDLEPPTQNSDDTQLTDAELALVTLARSLRSTESILDALNTESETFFQGGYTTNQRYLGFTL